MLLTNEYVSFTGFITDEELHEYYKGASFLFTHHFMKVLDYHF
ncbi:hypothetical protein ECLT68_2799 [Escherichia coli LT-68]|nr:hypothetical protein ECLT68_2799 [Escherichia coli LT-68]